MLFNLCRFTKIVFTIGLTPAGETIKLRITGHLGNLIMQPITAQHAEMGMLITSASAFRLISHERYHPSK